MTAMKSDKIVAISEDIRVSDVQDKDAHFSNKYPNFKKSYPTLFEMCCADHFDVKKMDFMIRMLKGVEENKVTQHNASVCVGQVLYDEYVKPIVGDGTK
jgi:hypothetical protein